MLALALIASGSGGAWADRLDQTACNVLKAELAGLVAEGVRDDMNSGPEWAKKNLDRERLTEIKRLIEVEAQLEFRCGVSRKGVLATKPSKTPEDPVAPKRKPPEDTQTTEQAKPSRSDAPAPARQMAAPVRTVEPARHDNRASAAAPSKPAVPVRTIVAPKPPAAAAAPVKAAAKSAGAATTAPATTAPAKQPAARPVSPVRTVEQAEGYTPAPKPTADAAAVAPPAAPRKSSRARAASAYVSPTDVNPAFLTRFGAAP